MANGGNPFVIDRLNEVREQNKDLYDQGKFDLLLDKFNDGFDFKIDNPGLLQEAYNYYDQLPPPIDDSEKKSKSDLISGRRKFGFGFTIRGRRFFIGLVRT